MSHLETQNAQVSHYGAVVNTELWNLCVVYKTHRVTVGPCPHLAAMLLISCVLATWIRKHNTAFTHFEQQNALSWLKCNTISFTG